MREVMKKVLLVGLLAAMLWTVAGCRMSGSQPWGEDTKKKLADQDKILAGVEKRRRDELMALIPEDQRKLAKDLELSALETVTSILGGVRPAAAAGADKGKIVEAGGVETIDQKPKDEKNKDEPNMEELLRYENFFDRSKVLKSLQK